VFQQTGWKKKSRPEDAMQGRTGDGGGLVQSDATVNFHLLRAGGEENFGS